MKNFESIYLKYNQAGPNYQYYPTTLGYQAFITHEDMINQLIGLNGKEINMQLLFPFCKDPDYHSTKFQIQLIDQSQLNDYFDAIRNELLIYQTHISKAKVVEIDFTGGEVSLLDETQLSQLFSVITDLFSVELKMNGLSIDINARLFDTNRFKFLKKVGFNKLHICTLNFDYNLRLENNKYQSYQHVAALIRQAKQLDFAAVHVELIYGLPNESCDSIKNTINTLIALNCEHVCLTHYFHRPFIFQLQNKLNQAFLPSAYENYYNYKLCVDKLLDAGYEHLGMNCFVSSDSQLYEARKKHTLSYNHTGFTLNTVNDTISLGASSISKIDNLFYQNPINITDYSESVQKGRIPNGKGCRLNSEQFLRNKIIKSLIINNHFEFDQSEKDQLNSLTSIDETFSHLYKMENDGLIQLSENSIRVTELGKYFLKNICALFDTDMKELIFYHTDM